MEKSSAVVFSAVFSAVLCGAAFTLSADELAANRGGALRWTHNGVSLVNLGPLFADRSWKFGKVEAGTGSAQPFDFEMNINGRKFPCRLATRTTGAKSAEAEWSFSSATAFPSGEIALTDDFAVGAVAGETWELGDRTGVFPATYSDQTVISAIGDHFTFGRKGVGLTTIRFPEPLHVLVQDNRRWGGQSFSIRIGHVMKDLKAGEPLKIKLIFSSDAGFELVDDLPVEITANDDWVPLKDVNLEIVPGSVLDLSGFGFVHAPCGAKGRIRTTPSGHFIEEREPQKPLRFYGINLCFDAQYLEHAEADRLLDRLVRLGYNTIRIHHYENELTTPAWKPGFDWDPKKLDKLDYLVAGCVKRGLYLTTDLYVNRPVPGTQIGLQGSNFDIARFKELVLIHEPAYRDLLTFTRNFLGRVNPYTGRTLAQEPALAWISLINEGPVGVGGYSKNHPQWRQAWNAYLAKSYPDADALDSALGDLRSGEDPKKGTVRFPEDVRDGSRRARVFQVFLANVERDFFLKVKEFLREDLKCEALLTDINCGGTRIVPMHLARKEFDYVDEHFYIDHPIFTGGGFAPPSNSLNSNPVRDGGLGGSESASARLWGKPFTVSEFNYSGPGRYRGVGGLLVGAMASLQDWDILWRFAYAHRGEYLFKPSRIDYFDMVRDPLNQAADRIATMLFLRRDIAPFPHRLSVDLPVATLERPPVGLGLNGLAPCVWKTAVGSNVAGDPAPKRSVMIPAKSANDADDVAARVKAAKLPSSPAVKLDQTAGTFLLDTPEIAGGYGPAGAKLSAEKSGVAVRIDKGVATVVVSAMDQNPIAKSARLLVTHLTDLQNSGVKYGDAARRMLNGWGDLPYLVQDGKATVAIKTAKAGKLKAWAVAPDGSRIAAVPVKTGKSGTVILDLSVRGPEGARMLYELAEK